MMDVFHLSGLCSVLGDEIGAFDDRDRIRRAAVADRIDQIDLALNIGAEVLDVEHRRRVIGAGVPVWLTVFITLFTGVEVNCVVGDARGPRQGVQVRNRIGAHLADVGGHHPGAGRPTPAPNCSTASIRRTAAR